MDFDSPRPEQSDCEIPARKKQSQRTTVFAQKILSGKSYFKALLEVYDILLAPVAFACYLIGRFFFAKTFYASGDCDNCDICIKACPVKAIIIVDKRPFWTLSCESCMKCMSNCPKKAIETGHGYIIGYSLIFSMVLLGVFYKYVGLYFLQMENGLLTMVVESVLFLSLLAILYRIVHWSVRFKIFERIIVFTSFTKYKWWDRRYKALKPDSNVELIQ